ncbi:MAG: hypothetical protein HQK51_13485 [Oligoflexia bacterium]|nr:hypothetical protein [Oligoflexia bacterium]
MIKKIQNISSLIFCLILVGIVSQLGVSVTYANDLCNKEGQTLKDCVKEIREQNRQAIATAICYSSFSSPEATTVAGTPVPGLPKPETSGHSIILRVLPNNNTDLNQECHKINDGWGARGVVKSNYWHQNCGSDIANGAYGGGYTSFVSRNYFESNRNIYSLCNSENAYICCSPLY